MAFTLVENRRKPWIDGLRGMAMLFVILGHVGVGNTFNTVTSPIKIPLFFAITGYLFQERKGKQLEFYGKLLLHLVLPWLALAMARYIPDAITQGAQVLLNGLIEVITGEVVWYMPCCVIAQIIHFYIRKFSKNATAVAVFSVVCAVIGYILTKYGILDIAMFNRSLVAQMFLLIGYLFRQWEDEPVLCGWLPAIIGTVLYAGLCVASLWLFPGRNLNVYANNYYHLPLCLLMIWIGCLTLLIWGSCIGKAPKLLQFVGQNTLVYYIWDPYPRVIVQKILGLFGLTLPDNWLGKVVLITVSLVGCGLASAAINWLLPELVGKKRQKNGKRKKK